MTRGEASVIIGLAVGSDADTVRKRFAEKVKQAHPDTGEDVANTHSLAKLKQARDVLLSAAGEVRAAMCPVCRGSGWVQVGFKQERCLRGC